MLELYNTPHSTCSQKVRICMAEKGLEWTDHLIDLGKKDQLDPDYLKLNPNGVVPTLVNDGTVILDSSVICEYIDELFPDPPLVPSDPAVRARMRAWIRYMEEVPTKAVRVPSFNMAFLPRFDGLDDEQFQEREAGPRPLRKHFFETMGREGFADEEVRASMEQLRQTCERMDEALTAEGPWLMGEAYTLADIIVAPLIDRMADLEYANLWSDLPTVVDWYDRMRARPAFKTAFYERTRVSEFLALTPLKAND
ncbi:MAG: glutathione S-transferase family protein [Alphaproteobacteria bacterium]|nr:glutathione S-transferase family protein [Alphaproteobacteria bacterium]